MRDRETDAADGEPYPDPQESAGLDVAEAAVAYDPSSEDTTMLAISPSQAFLHAHGIRVTPARMAELVREAVERFPRSLYPNDPRHELTAAEVAALEEGGFDLSPEPNLLDPTDDPLARTAAELAALLETSLSTSQAARRLGVDSSRIRQRLTAQPPTLYGIRRGAGWVVPEVQFDGDRLLPGIGEVVAQLDPDLHPATVVRWFTTPQTDLVADESDDDSPAMSPRDWLRLGFPPRVVAELAAEL